MPQVTVIVPIYNVERYLKKCFDSLLKQTSDDYVVLAVNDGSPDGCDAIIAQYVKSYPDRFKGIKKKNGGYGSVLQIAIRETKTPYFLVCDPDDTLEPEAVQTLLSMAKMSGADITVGAKTLIYEDSDIREYDASYNKEFTTLKKDTVYDVQDPDSDGLWFINPSPHAKLYRTEIARGITFPEHVGYTDNMLFYLSMLNAKKLIYTDQPLAEYLINRKGNSMGDVSAPAMNGEILVFKSILSQAEHIENVPDMFYYRMYESFRYMLQQMPRLNCSREDFEIAMDYLGTYSTKLSAYGSIIRPLYQQYAKVRPLEKIRDLELMNSRLSAYAFERLKKKMMKEYDEKHRSDN